MKDILRLNPKQIKELGLKKKDIQRLRKIKIPFPRTTYERAIEILKLPFGSDISSKNEQKLIKKLGGQPVFIKHFPNPLYDHGKEIEVEKFFNMLPDPKNPKYVLSADLILPLAGEAVGAAQRVHNLEELKWRLENSKMFKRLKAKGGGIEGFEWYLKRVGEKSIPHVGGGFGIARILKFIKGEKDIKKQLLFLRIERR